MANLLDIVFKMTPQRTDYTGKKPLSSLEELVKDYMAQSQDDTPGLTVTGLTRGMTEPGNIDLYNRPRVRNDDGSVSTVRSMIFNVDGNEVMVPSVSDEGRIMDPQETIGTYMKTGKHLGKFSSPDDAENYAQNLHYQQDRLYGQPNPSTLAAINTALAQVSPAAGKMKKPDRPDGAFNLYNLLKDGTIYRNSW